MLRASAERIGPDPDFNSGTGSGMLRVDKALARGIRPDPSEDYERLFMGQASSLVPVQFQAKVLA